MDHDIALPQTSLLTHLQCSGCGHVYDAGIIHTYCTQPGCGQTLFAQYNYHAPPDKADLKNRPATMWRYKEFMPIVDEKNIITLGEGFTPMIPLRNLSYLAGDNEVVWKDESGNPTGSFKARGLSAAVSKAKEFGVQTIAVPTAGNAGGALAAYAARAGIKAVVYMPKLTPQVFKDECHLYGAKLVQIDGSISDCGKLANEDAQLNGWFQVSTLKEPYRLE